MSTTTTADYLIVAAKGVGEKITLAAPKDWHDRIVALTPFLAYGPDYRRDVAYALGRMSGAVMNDYPDVALGWLVVAERYAA